MLDSDFTKYIGVADNKSFYELYEQLDYKKKIAKFLELDYASYTGKLPQWFEKYKGKSLTINYSEDNSSISLLSVRNIILAKAPNLNNEILTSPMLLNVKNVRLINGNYQLNNIPDKLDYLYLENANSNLDISTFNVKTLSLVITDEYSFDYNMIDMLKKAIANSNIKKIYLNTDYFPELSTTTVSYFITNMSKLVISALWYPQSFKQLITNKMKIKTKK